MKTDTKINKSNIDNKECPFLDNGILKSKIYDKRNDFSFRIVNYPFLDGDVPLSPSYGVYRLARICNIVSKGIFL